MFNTIKEKYGRLDILVNNAGTCVPGSFATFKSEDWLKMINVRTFSAAIIKKK